MHYIHNTARKQISVPLGNYFLICAAQLLYIITVLSPPQYWMTIGIEPQGGNNIQLLLEFLTEDLNLNCYKAS